MEEVKNYSSQKTDITGLAQQLRLKFEKLPELKNIQTFSKAEQVKKASKFLNEFIENEDKFWEILISWMLIHELGKIAGEEDFEDLSRSWIDEWLLGKIMNSVFQKTGLNESQSWQALVIVKILCSSQNWSKNISKKKQPLYQLLNTLLEDPLVQQYLQVNRHQDILWFNKESFASLAGWLFSIGALHCLVEENNKLIGQVFSIVKTLFEIGEVSGYRVDALLEGAKV